MRANPFRSRHVATGDVRAIRPALAQGRILSRGDGVTAGIGYSGGLCFGHVDPQNPKTPKPL